MKPVAITLGVLTAGAAGAWIFGFVRTKTADEALITTQLEMAGKTPVPNPITRSHCDALRSSSGEFDKLCTGSDITYWAAPVTVVLGIGTIITGYLAMRHSDTEVAPSPTGSTGSRRTKRKNANVTVTPIISPDGGGATFRLDW